jgi:hypothetical protein
MGLVNVDCALAASGLLYLLHARCMAFVISVGQELSLGLKGLSVMSADMEQLARALVNNQVRMEGLERGARAGAVVHMHTRI